VAPPTALLAVVALLVIVALPAVEVLHEECDAGVAGADHAALL